jgi:LPXTG-motif cell wall-anchored protein
VTLFVLAALLASPAPGASAAAPAPSRLVAAPPAWLTAGGPAQTVTTRTTPPVTRPYAGVATVSAGESRLPRTGEDLLPVAVVGAGLLAAGVLIGARRA